MNRSRVFATVAASLITFTVAGAGATAQAADVVTPEYQVKLLLTDSAVDESGNPSQQLRDAFKVSADSEGSEESTYFDTADGFYARQGWSIRLRHKDGAAAYDVTFKNRTALADNSLSKNVIDEGLAAAKKKNFDASDSNYAAQVNSSYSTSTLDFSTKKDTACPTAACDMPSKEQASALLAGIEPGKMSKATNSSLNKQNLVMSKTVEQSTWRVEIDGIKTDLEISQFAGKKWVEISEEETSRSDAKDKRDKLIKALESKGFLQKQDAFKTGVVLAASGVRS